MTDWSIKDSVKTYSIPRWGEGYIDINSEGHLVVYPDRDQSGQGIDLYQLLEELKQSGLTLPVLVRFSGILKNRIDLLNQAFDKARAACGYQGDYTPIYPIKVNQQRSVVESLMSYGGKSIGLESGSKPELMAILALMQSRAGTVVCNGYKDREYVRLALIGSLLENKVYIVVEKLSELDLILEESRIMGISPRIGVRIRLASIGEGKWQNSGGSRAKFGLSTTHLLELIHRLKENEMLDSLQLLHFHIGSQIPNIQNIRQGVSEAAKFYNELISHDVPIDTIDVGGGLGVDYEGTRSRSFCSMNYSMDEYAAAIINTINDICNRNGLPHPAIFTESGRSLTAHHAVLITNVIDTERVPEGNMAEKVSDDSHDEVRSLSRILENISTSPLVETYHAAVNSFERFKELFCDGSIGLEQRACAEQLYYAICKRLQPMLLASSRSHREIIDSLNEQLSDKYFCNLSIFQSMPDVWAIDQVFPIVPLHRLDERPDRRVVIEDLTCDSDGRIDNYVDREGVESTIPLHSKDGDQPYFLGIFLVGAYQEILGDMHNLFGDTDSVHVETGDVKTGEDGGYQLNQILHGDNVGSILQYVNFDREHLAQSLTASVSSAGLGKEQQKSILEELLAGLDGYTYHEA